MHELKIAAILMIIGLGLMVVNELIKVGKTKVIYRYIPRDLDTYFKDPKNQPMYVYKSMFDDENIRMY